MSMSQFKRNYIDLCLAYKELFPSFDGKSLLYYINTFKEKPSPTMAQNIRKAFPNIKI